MTGGANGLGRAICCELAKYGCNLAVADVDIKHASNFAEELTFLGVKAKAYEVKKRKGIKVNILIDHKLFL